MKEEMKIVGAVNGCVHEENRPLWEEAGEKALSIGINIRHNSSCRVRWMGIHRYVAFIPGTHYAKGSRGVLHCEETPFSRFYKPSVSREKECILGLMSWLDGASKEMIYDA